ncbi:hypothetical protein Lal_00033456 [Lupinus albus]|nr:hypothetical protein Lal_00033456 [Lupinus albus]
MEEEAKPNLEKEEEEKRKPKRTPKGGNEFISKAEQRNSNQFEGGFNPDVANEWVQNWEHIFRAIGFADA